MSDEGLDVDDLVRACPNCGCPVAYLLFQTPRCAHRPCRYYARTYRNRLDRTSLLVLVDWYARPPD